MKESKSKLKPKHARISFLYKIKKVFIFYFNNKILLYSMMLWTSHGPVTELDHSSLKTRTHTLTRCMPLTTASAWHTPSHVTWRSPHRVHGTHPHTLHDAHHTEYMAHTLTRYMALTTPSAWHTPSHVTWRSPHRVHGTHPHTLHDGHHTEC